MRTTVTLDPDVDMLVKRAMKERGLTFKQALNEAIRAGMAPGRREPAPRFETHDMGEATVDVTKALQLADNLEGEELARKLSQGK
jgi:hypothetical protein